MPYSLGTSKWTVPVLLLLSSGTLRFGALLHGLAEISSKTLSVTLRQLERDGLVFRQVFPTIPPRVDYWLTPLGEELVQALAPIAAFTDRRRSAIHAAQQDFDGRA